MVFDLARIEALLDLLGSPQRAYPAIHLTGTNGKTSTARMIDSLLRAHGLRTGRYTSPHLETVRERISDRRRAGRARRSSSRSTARSRRSAQLPRPARRSRRGREPDLLRHDHGDGAGRVRRRPGRRGRGRGRAGRRRRLDERAAGQHVRHHPDRARPHGVARRHDRGDRPGQGRHHPQWSDGDLRAAAGRGDGPDPRALRRGRRDDRPRGQRVRRPAPRARGRRPGAVAAGARRRCTTRSSCRCTAPTRRRTRPSRWPRSRRFLGVPGASTAASSTRRWCARASPGRPRPAGWSGSAPRRRSCSTRPTTRTAWPPRCGRCRRSSRSAGSSWWSRCWPTRTWPACWSCSSRSTDAVVCTRNTSPRAMPVDRLADLAESVFGEERVSAEAVPARRDRGRGRAGRVRCGRRYAGVGHPDHRLGRHRGRRPHAAGAVTA